MIPAARALQRHDLSGEGIKLWITYILFWPQKDMEGLPGWVISPMPGSLPRQHKHERQYTPSIHSVIPTRRIWNDDNDGQMIFGEPWGPKVSWHLSYRWGKTPKKPHPGNLSRPGIEPGPAAWQARMIPLAPQRWTAIYIYCGKQREATAPIKSLVKLQPRFLRLQWRIYIIIRVFCPKAGPLLKAEKPRLQFCRR